MGQQQLLLIVLGVVIVGVAVVAGIGLFSAGAEEAVKDELVSQCMAIAADAQKFYNKPSAMGGGNLSFTGYLVPPRMAATTNAGVVGDDGKATTVGYAFEGDGQGATITATPNLTDYSWTVTCTVTPYKITTTIN